MFKYQRSGGVKNLLILIFSIFAGAVGYVHASGGALVIVSAFLVALIFLATFFTEKIRGIFESRILVFLGLMSYPLYIIHNNIATGLSIKFHALNPNLSPILYPLPGIITVLFISRFLFLHEARFRAILDKFFSRFVPSMVH